MFAPTARRAALVWGAAAAGVAALLAAPSAVAAPNAPSVLDRVPADFAPWIHAAPLACAAPQITRLRCCATGVRVRLRRPRRRSGWAARARPAPASSGRRIRPRRQRQRHGVAVRDRRRRCGPRAPGLPTGRPARRCREADRRRDRRGGLRRGPDRRRPPGCTRVRPRGRGRDVVPLRARGGLHRPVGPLFVLV